MHFSIQLEEITMFDFEPLFTLLLSVFVLVSALAFRGLQKRIDVQIDQQRQLMSKLSSQLDYHARLLNNIVDLLDH